MIKLSIAIITKNEETSISRCLESVKNADEIIVVDTGSTDKTIEIARKYTDKVFTDYKWNDNFAEARNHANSKCTGDWIMVIDSDNRLMNSIAEVKAEIEKAEKNGFKSVNVRVCSDISGEFSHSIPMIYKNSPDIYWKGAAHNYITLSEGNESPITIRCWMGEAHEKDPDRTRRILKKEVESNPKLVREKYYYSRECFNRGDYITPLYWLQEYLKISTFGKEMVDARLTLARCYWYLGHGDLARAHCLEAICLDANHKEALLFMAEMSGPKNRDRWIWFADSANDQDTLFVRRNYERDNKFYDEAFKQNSDMSRYQEILEDIGKIVGEHSVLDIGCGTAELSKYVKNYKGFDFSEEAIKIAKALPTNPDVWVGNAYDKENYKEADYYVLTETLEHLDDLKVLDLIPKGKIIFSVPSFNDTAHLRVYTEKTVRERFKFLDIQKITRYNWKDKWTKTPYLTQDNILLVESLKK